MSVSPSMFGISAEAETWARDARLMLRAQVGGQVARWMSVATLTYILLFYFVLKEPLAGHISVVVLLLHMIGWLLHRREVAWAATLNLLVGLTHLGLLDIAVLHTERSVYLWMMCIPPFAVLACASALERRVVIGLSVLMMIACSKYNDALNGVSFNTSSVVTLISIIGSSLLLSYITRWSLLQIERSQALLAEEHTRSEALLLNVLPREVVGRLKDSKVHLHECTIADNYQRASVLFADIVGFTELSSKMPPQQLVELLNRYFITFDYLSAQHEVEKIKTIGDAYMAATGILHDDEGSLKRLAQLSIAMHQEVEKLNQELNVELKLRIGLHTGPVTAGVIGSRKFIYDLWGDTVNIAARMESHGIPKRTQVSEAVYLNLKGRFLFEPLGAKTIKGKGEMNTYLLISERIDV